MNPQCKAKSKRTGNRCQRPAMNGKKVCYYHGGKSPGAPKKNKNAFKHSFYSQLYVGDDQEKVQALSVELASGDHLELLKSHLVSAISNHAKMIVAQRTYYEEREKVKANGLDMETLSKNGEDADGNKYVTLHRLRDFSNELHAAQNQVLKIVKEIHAIKMDLGLDKDTEKIIFDLKFNFDEEKESEPGLD